MRTLQVVLLLASSLVPLSASGHPASPTVDQCAHDPALFRMSKLSAQEAERLIREINNGPQRVGQFIDGYVLTGHCAKYIIRSDPLMLRLDLSNGASFVAQMPPYRLVPAAPATYSANSFSPPPNVLTIRATPAGVKGPLHYVESQDTGTGLRFAIWSGTNGSVVGTIICKPGGTAGACTLGDLFLISSYKIRRLQYMPGPHPTGVGSLALWIADPRGREAFVEYGLSGVN